MRCKYCHCLDSKVIDSRPAEEGMSIRRRRECISCGRRFTTYEKIEMVPILVVKKDGRREAYDSAKVKNSLLRACEKRTISIAEIDGIVNSVEQAVYSEMIEEVSSSFIGEKVMQALKVRDQVAYVRFASVYRQFTDIGSFMDELSKMLTEQRKQ